MEHQGTSGENFILREDAPSKKRRGSSLKKGRTLPGRTASPGEVRARVLETLRKEGFGKDQAGEKPAAEGTAKGVGLAESAPQGRPVEETVPVEPIPARMLNEFVYCPRLFYYEYVDGVFVENADTLRGSAIHKRVDSGNGAMPKPAGNDPAMGKPDTAPSAESAEREVIHSRSVSMGSDRLGVVAKMDLVEARAEARGPESMAGMAEEGGDLFEALEVCPVDYKAGAPREGTEGNELWDTDKMQLGLQALILRDNGYKCNEGIIYYRATKQRVRLEVTGELEAWIRTQITEARRTIMGPIPPPLVHSPKCVRCSLAPVCLPDETRMLAGRESEPKVELIGAEAPEVARRLMVARDDRRPLYLTTPGLRVGCTSELLQVKEKDRVTQEVRLRDVTHVALFGNIQISTQAIQALCELEVPVTYFSMGGWFYGITRGHGLKNVFLRIEQFRQARDERVCLGLAKQFVQGKIRNHRTLLMRNHLQTPEGTILRLKRAAEEALEAQTAEELLGIEGAAASEYFQQFNGMIKVADELAGGSDPQAQLGFNFSFAQRNRRPPTDPVNAMLSLAYSMLSKDCTLAALATGFDPYVGFYHQPRFGRPALGLDLMEEFRPLIAESTVLNCINNRVVTEKDFVRAGQAVNLTANGRKRFFQAYEQRMSALITHPLFEYKVSYRRALELQARLLAKTLTGEIPNYIPLLTR